MNILVTGAEGQLGTELVRQAPACGVFVTAPLLAEMDLTNSARVEEVFAAVRPAAVINAAAYTLVDRAETESELAFAVNAAAPAHLARLCGRAGIPLVQVSTDYVFDGRKQAPYVEDDPVAPMGVYGRSKAEGEAAVRGTLRKHLIVRTAWLYSCHGENFVLKMLRLMRERDSLRVVADQIGTPTCARGLAQAIWRITALSAMHGIFHWTDAGTASWYDFAVAIQEEAARLGMLDRMIPIVPIRTADYPTAARRPAYSVLDKSSTWERLGYPALHWRAALRSMLEELHSAPHE
jgi:dTDP-4-dehydrorhamnose reductase